MNNEQQNGLSLPTALVIAAVLISGALVYLAIAMQKGGPSGQVAKDPEPSASLEEVLTLGERDVILGEENAPVTLIEYGDYQCPFCVRFFQNTEPLIRTNYVSEGKVRVIFRDLAFLGPESVAAAGAAECAKDQGKFWAFHDALYEAERLDAVEHNGNLNRALFLTIAESLGMNASQFASCYDNNTYAQVVQDTTAKANAAGITATPTSLINDVIIEGAQPYAQFQAAIEAALD